MAGDVRIAFTPSNQIKLYLNELKRMGIYGKKRGDVVNYILSKEIMRLVEGGVLKRLSPELEDAADTSDDDEE